MKKGFLLFFLFICWSVIGQANEKNNNKEQKLRRQDNKTTRQQKIQEQKQNNNNNNKTTTVINKQQQNNKTTTTTNNNQQQPTTTNNNQQRQQHKTRKKPQQQPQLKKITATEQQKTKLKNNKTTKTENEVPENDVDHKAPPSKSECYDPPAIYFSAKFSEVHKDSIRSSQKRLFPQFRGVLGPMRSQRPHVAKNPRKTPRNRSHRRNSAVTTRGSAARTPRVARCRTKTSPNRSESGFSEPANARRRRENDSRMGTCDGVKRSEVAFSAPPKDPKTRSAPQENPLRGKNAPRHESRKRIGHFSFRHQNFSQTFRGHVLPTKDATAQTR